MKSINNGEVGQVLSGMHKNKGYEVVKVFKGTDTAKVKLYVNNSRRLCDYLFDAMITISELKNY